MKFLRYIQKKRRAILAMAAFTLFASPFSAQASITPKDSSHSSKITFKNKVYTIEVQKELSKQVGVNKFKDFSLDKGQIANLKMGNLQTLANLVDNKISINGTVNALRGDKIGGNLYFLSPNGIAVGSSGVINAGSFTGMAVSQSYFDKLSKIENGGEFMTELAPTKIQYNNDSSKGIDIQGVINAPGGINLYATKIDVGTNAILRTDVEEVDFTKVVNVLDSKGKVLVNAGIKGELDASYSGGDIVLKAHAEHIADDNMLTNIQGAIDGTGTATRWIKDKSCEAIINVDGKIDSAGDVKINADSVISFSEGSKWNVVTQSKILESFLGSIGFDVMADGVKRSNKATVNIGKTANIHSAGAMAIDATANLSVTLSAQTPSLKTGAIKIDNFVPAIAVAVIKADNKAEVNINGKLESEGTMSITANAETTLSNTAKAATQLESEELQKIVDGGKSSVPEDHNFIAVGVIDGETKADVNIKKGSKITVNGADYEYTTYAEDDVEKKKPIKNHVDGLTIKATTTNTVGNEVSATPNLTNVETASATAVAVTNYNGEANVNLEDEIKAEKGNAVIEAANTFSNTNDTSNALGAEPEALKVFAEMPSTEFLETLSVAGSKKLSEKLFSKLKLAAGEMPLGSGNETFAKIFNGEYLKMGSSVSVFNQDNKATVNIGDAASIKALKSIDISSTNKIASQKLSTTAQVNNEAKQSKTKLMFGIGVQVSNVKNNADAIIKGSINSTTGNVNVTSYAGMNYNTAKALRDKFYEFFTSMGKQFKDFGGNFKNIFAKYESQIKEELANLENAKDPEAYMTALKALNEKIADTKSTGFDAFVKTLDKGSEIKQSLEGVIPTLSSFLHPSNYTNYYVRSAFVEGKSADDVTSSQLSGAGSFAINSMPNTSRVILAENSKITADIGAVNIKSNAENRVVAITGMGGEYGTSSTAANRGAGISVKVGTFADNSIVAVGKNAQIKGSNVSIDSKEYAKHFNVIYGNGKADSLSITGMVSYFNSPANNIISIDDSATLDAKTFSVAEINNVVALNADSERYITTVTGGITLGNGNGKSFGATISVMNNPVNNAIVLADNGQGTRSAITGTTLEDKVDAKILTLTNKTLEILDDKGNLLGNSSIDGTGSINADIFNVYAKKTGTINAIAVAGTENSETHGFFDGYNKYVKSLSDKLQLGEIGVGMLSSRLSKWLGSKVKDKLPHSGENNAEQAAGEALGQAGNAGEELNLGVNNDDVTSQLNFAGAGSVAVNMNSGETGSFVSNYKINTDTSNVRANDDTFHGSWAGAGAFNFFGAPTEIAENTNVAIGGSLALTTSEVNINSVIKNSTINAQSLTNEAIRADSDVSAGMGLAVSTNSTGTQVNIPISASINLLNGDTHSLLLSNTVKGSSIENKATIDSVQVAGGLSLGVSKGESKGFSIGGNAAASQITNDLQSGIKGGSYENLGKVDITAIKKSNQVDVAVAGGVTAGGGDDSGGFAFGGAVAVSDIKNNSNAFLKDTTNFNANGVINVDALENKNSSSRDSYLLSRKIDIDPTSYLANSDKNKINTINGGGNIVNVAFGGGGSTSGAAAGGLGISYAGLTNTMNVDISDNQNITAQYFNVNTTNKSNIVNVTVGFAGSKGSFSLAGSAGVSDIKNDGTINISNSNVTTDSFFSGTQSSAHIVNVAGQASLSDSFAAGLTFAYNAMNNTTGINIKNGNWKVKEFDAHSANNNYALAVGAGVSFAKDGSALNGSVGLNMGTNSTKSIVDGAKNISGIENMKVIATDNTSKTTVAGGVNISNGGVVALGGAVAYANIGKASNKEIINAKIINSNIITENNSSIEVEALDKAIMTTVGAGAGGSISTKGLNFLTFQGAAAVSEVNKDNIAEISNTDITGGAADIKVIATSGGNSSDGLTIKGSKINVNNKINTAAAVLDANLSDYSWFDGAFAISVNKFNQSTQAIFKGTREMGEGKWEKGNEKSQEIISRAGNVDIFSNSEADILGIGIGGAGGRAAISAAGSTSLNYINNSAKSLVENLNVKADKNFGVVAQSDDKIANYAGAVDVDLNGYGSIGVSVAINEITGNTDANIKNSKLEVSGSDSDLIAISNPKDNLIDGYVTKNNWTSGGLFSGRKSENKSGVVVNSSATHSISSDLATIGIRATGDGIGAGVSGTVNINKIGGSTNAKVESTDVASNPDSFVNASDYTNNGSFIGNAAVSGTVAVGVLWNENKIERKTNSLVNGGTLNVKNLDVKADNRQGLSNLNIAVGAGFMDSDDKLFAAASGDNIVRNQMEGVTTAKIENATVNHSGAVDVNAYHKGNIYATNIAAGVAASTTGQDSPIAGGATFDLGYGLMRENSTVEAEINNSTLTSTSGAVNVNAENNSKLAGAFGTAGVAAHVGNPGFAASVALGINNIYVTNTVHGGIKGSTLNVGAVDVNAKNISEVKADGGVAAVAVNISKTFFASLGASVAVTNATFDNKVTADVDKSTINAAGDVNINAQDDHKSNETVVSAALSTGLAVSVNRMATSINNGLANLNENQLGKTLSSGDLKMTSQNASKANANSDSDKLTGEYGSENRFINNEAINNLLGGVRVDSSTTKKDISETLQKRYTATVNYNNSLKKGVFANVQNGSTITATNDISINSTENNDLAITSGSGNAGPIGIGVGSTSIKVHRANTANVIGSELKAKNIEISTTNGQTGSDGINSRMYNATLAGVGVSVGYNNVETNGTGEILISNSNITASENLNATATDNSKSRSYILDAGLKIAGYTGVFAYNTNIAQTGIEISNKSALNAKNINFAAQNQTYRATDTLAISGSALNVQTSTSEAKDSSSNFIKVEGSGNSFTADQVNITALNGSQTYAHTNGQAYLGLNAVVAKGLAHTNSNANISIDDANTFKAGTVNITSQIGEDNKYTAEATGFAINGSALGVNVDDMTAKTESTAKITVGNEIYGDATTLNISALNRASRNAFMRNNAYSIVANANDISAYTKANDKAAITVGSKGQGTRDNGQVNKLGALNITADTSNKSYVAAKGTGGSIGGDFGSAAHADNEADNTSEAILNGIWNIAGDLTLTANQHDSAYISGYSARGAILTGGKGSLDNVIKGSSTATISDNANITAKTVNVNSQNYIKTDKYSDDYDYTLFGRMGGVVDDVDYQRSTATTTKSASINIGDSVGITTTGTQTYDAASNYDLKNNVYAEGGSLLMSLRWVKSHNYITADEKISVGNGATLKNEGGTYADGGITMAAHDNLELNPTAKGYSQAGTGGYVRAENIIELNRNQNINIDGTLKSAKDLNLYAGADVNGEGSRVHSYARAISQVITLISDGSADIIRKGATNSNVNIKSGAYGQAAHDVNIISNAGWEAYEEKAFYGSTWSSSGGYKAVTSDKGDVTTSGYKHNNKVKVDGELKAANNPDVTINISGIAIPDGFILTNSNFKNLGYSVQSGDVTITEKNTDLAGKSSKEIFAQQLYNGIKTASTDYANDYLLKRYSEITKLMGQYSGDAVAYSGLKQEKVALETEMLNLGIGSYIGGEFKVGTSPSIEIKTVVLPDIEVSGGNINVSTNNFSGKGSLSASGIPKIDIKNNSSAYLITNRLAIGSKGGAINYNGTSVKSNAAIGSGANFAEIKTSDTTQIPTITVSNNYAGQSSIPMKPDPNAKGYDTLPENAKNETRQYTPINFIEVTKDISNPVGNVKIKNAQGSIRILSGANVNGMNVEMTAKNSISQGYTDGIVNIAYKPEDRYASAIAKLRADTGWDKNLPESNQTITKTDNTMATDGGGRIAGDAIYISARDININGLIQAGYNGYKASITQADVDNAKETAFFNGVTMYKVNSGGSKLGSDGYYIYEPQIYYDKTNQKLYVEDINAAGGKVYLTGRILSTGNGKIVVADGASNIDITNSSKVDMNVGKVISSEGRGLIQIVDTAQDKLSQYSSGQTRTIENYSSWLADNSNSSVTTSDGLTVGQFIQYKPKTGLTYNWGEGVRQEQTTHYYYKEELSLWGWIGDSKYTSDLVKLTEIVKSIKDAKKASSWDEPKLTEPLDIGNGIYISDSTKASGYITMLAQNILTKNSYGNHTTEGPDKRGFVGFYRDYDHRWTKTTGAKQIYQYAIKADYPISVGIIGESNPNINLTNTSTRGGDLYLTNDIRNDIGATLSIRAAGGKIEQSEGVKISTNNIKLTAREGIKNIDVTNNRTDDLKLNAQTTVGDVDIKVSGGNKAGNVIVDALKSDYNGVTLKTTGDIKQAIDDTTITARNIKLESANGAINLQIESNGQGSEVSAISAAAQGDIKLNKNDNSDFLIGSIVSTNGDVTLTAKGKFVDALDKVRDNGSNDESDLVKSWIDMGLIAGTADYKGAYITRLEHDRDNYKSDVTAQFTEYQTLLAEYNALHEQFSELEKGDRLTTLEKKFGRYATADVYLAADKDYQTLVATVKNPQYKWTEDELLSGIRSAIVNKQESTASDVTRLKDANITGRNVTLTGAGVGTNSKEITTIKMSELRVKAGETDKEKSARLAKLSKLANVEAADVKVNFVLDKNGKPVVQTVERVNYNYDADKGYYIDTAGNYIRYRKDADGNLLKYTYDKDLKQIGSAVAVSDFSDVIKGTTTIENKQIESFNISGTIPLGINATGNITVKTTGTGGVYIAGRNKGVKIDEAQNPNNDIYSELNINKIETAKADGNYGDVRIIGEAGIFNANNSGANVVGKDLVIVGGNGAIGIQAKPLTVTLTGDLLSARSNDEINLQKIGKDNFRISAIYSPKNIRIANDQNGIIEHSQRFDDIAAAYINSPAEITLTGSAGTADNPILIRPTATTTLNLLPSPFSLTSILRA